MKVISMQYNNVCTDQFKSQKRYNGSVHYQFQNL